jgi:hypothetical protein
MLKYQGKTSGEVKEDVVVEEICIKLGKLQDSDLTL